MFRDKSRFLAFTQSCGVLIKISNLSQSLAFPEKFCSIWKSHPFPQTHSHPFAVRHNLLSSKESVSSSYKAPYPFLLSMEFAAVQIIAVDTERKSGLLIAGYLMNAGDFSKNNVSTGDLNRGRRVKPRLLFGSFCRSKKNKPVPFRELSRFHKPRISAPLASQAPI